MVFDTTILGSNPSAPAKIMIKKISNNLFFQKIKKILFPFYKSKEISFIFDVLEKDKPKNKKVAMFVGGCVRNYILGKKIDDIDIATILTPKEIKKKFENTNVKIIETGIEHGSITLLLNNFKFELTTLRRDIKTDGRFAEISYTDDWEEDSGRRDITINAIYLDRKGKIYDPQSGLKDLNSNKVKFIGDPSKRIQEDYLRIIRFLRFALKYDSNTDQLTIEALKLNLNGIKFLSKERVLNELFKILKLTNFKNIFKHPNKKLIFLLIFPELKYLDRYKKIDLIQNLKIDINLTLAILLIDGTVNHEYFCHKYKVSNEIKDYLSILSKNFLDCRKDKNYFKKDLSKNIYYLGKDTVKNLAKLMFFVNKNALEKEISKSLDIIEKNNIPKFPFDGKYLINLGLSEGRNIGKAIKILEKEWVENKFFIKDSRAQEIIKKVKN